LKAKHLIEGEHGQPSLYAAGKAVVDYKISLSWWKLAKIA